MAIEVGQRAKLPMVVGIEDTAEALVSGTVAMLATPRVVAWVEAASVAAIHQELEPGTTSVGTHIDLRHVAPSPIGTEVVATAEVIAVAGRRIEFSVSASDGEQDVAFGTHTRVVVELASFGQ